MQVKPIFNLLIIFNLEKTGINEYNKSIRNKN